MSYGISSPRRVMYVHLEKVFEEAGYWTTVCHMPRWRILAMLWIACTQVAAVKGNTPRNVWRTLQIMFTLTLRGRKFSPVFLHPIWAKGKRGEDCDARHCPCCGRELPEELQPESQLDLSDRDAVMRIIAEHDTKNVTNAPK